MRNPSIYPKTIVPQSITYRENCYGTLLIRRNSWSSKDYSYYRSVSCLHVSLSSPPVCLSSLSHVCLSSLSHVSPLFLSLLFHIFPCLFLSSYDLSLSPSFHLSPNDDDNDHSSTRLPVQKTLTLRGLGPSLVGELVASCRNNLSRCTCCIACVVCE